MKPGLHPWRMALILLASVVGLGLALRQDLANLARYRVTQYLQANDPAAAEAAFENPLLFAGDRHLLAQALGVAWYRQGRFDTAEYYFSAASAACRTDLAAAAYFNRGNARYRRAQQMVAEQRAQAVQTMRAATSDFEQALQLEAHAVDAQENLHRARNWIMQWAIDDPGMEENVKSAGKQQAASSNDGRSSSEKLAEAGRAVPLHKPLSNKMTALSDASDQGGPHGMQDRDLTRHEAEQLLSEARHREKILGLPDIAARHAGRESPEKDW
jgi:hypothetical protein